MENFYLQTTRQRTGRWRRSFFQNENSTWWGKVGSVNTPSYWRFCSSFRKSKQKRYISKNLGRLKTSGAMQQRSLLFIDSTATRMHTSTLYLSMATATFTVALTIFNFNAVITGTHSLTWQLGNIPSIPRYFLHNKWLSGKINTCRPYQVDKPWNVSVAGVR